MTSGLDVTLHDLFRDEEAGPAVYRARYVAPGIALDDLDYESVAADMEILCRGDALPQLASADPAPQRIVVTLMSEPAEFGAANPDITQFFESFSIENDLCIWEAF
ncbi:acetolactate synthase [Thalassococcus sp. CAU 1522]|uniref:Acetolactate synthase n=1 Tax=Thalassococcus arenae TaxID=2851652 RepID=A0ABS6N8Z0_9RHOB|nr:acetolactate synthase [Thalassococcus arenae]